MTTKEAIKELREASDNEVRYGDTEHHYNEVMKRIEALEMAIKALQAQSCEDCISREAVLDIIKFEYKWLLDTKIYDINTSIAFSSINTKIKSLLPVTPKAESEVEE